jgi:hypothetical protein
VRKVAAFGFLVWDVIMTFEDEVEYIWRWDHAILSFLELIIGQNATRDVQMALLLFSLFPAGCTNVSWAVTFHVQTEMANGFEDFI